MTPASTMSSLEEAIGPADDESARKMTGSGELIARASERFRLLATDLVWEWDKKSMQMLQNLYRAMYLILLQQQEDTSWLEEEYAGYMPQLLQDLKINDHTKGRLQILPTQQMGAIRRLTQYLEEGDKLDK